MSSEKQKADKGNKFRFSKILLHNRKRNEDNLANLAIQLAETNRKLEEEIAERKKIEEELVRNEQRWITTLRSIGDAVIATDTAGNVTFMNKVAEDLTGWSITEAQQKPLAKVFNIGNEQSRQQVESPIAEF
jgi:PAS domain-containing protein